MKSTTPASPYLGEPEEAWLRITRGLLATHPLKVDSIREVALTAWAKVWDTTVGSGDTAIRLADLRVPATVVGYFFEVLLARELQHLYPDDWGGNRSGDEKDLVYIKDRSLSIEMKSSGQLGDRVYGNRSYGQQTQNEDLVKKEKSGYYITANFYGQTLTLLRFGWIDASDWKPQASPTGQMAGLSDAVYAKKLIAIPGEYQLDAPVELLEGVGPKIATEFCSLQIRTIRELLEYPGRLTTTRQRSILAATIAKYRPSGASCAE